MWLLREKAVPSALGLLLALLPISGADYTPNGYDCDYKHVGVDQAVVRLDRFTGESWCAVCWGAPYCMGTAP